MAECPPTRRRSEPPTPPQKPILVPKCDSPRTPRRHDDADREYAGPGGRSAWLPSAAVATCIQLQQGLQRALPAPPFIVKVQKPQVAGRNAAKPTASAAVLRVAFPHCCPLAA